MSDASALLDRIQLLLGAVTEVTADDDALTVHYDGLAASLRVVTLAAGLDVVSLTQVLAWDQPLGGRLRASVAKQNGTLQFGSLNLAERGSIADVLLRYNFPVAGLADEPLTTLLLMVLGAGADAAKRLRPQG